MTAFATGVAKRVAIVEETTYGTNPVTGGTYLRRVSSDLALGKDAYESNEILLSQQLRDARHGVRRPAGTFSGQVSPSSFTNFWEGLLRKSFAATAPVSQDFAFSSTAHTLTGTGLNAAGLKKNDVFRLSGVGSPNAALNGVNLRIANLSDTVITIFAADQPTSLTTGTLTGATLTVVGKKVWMPATGQLYKSYAIEHWFSDIAVSELFTGCRFGQSSIAMPATGLVTFNTQIMGQDMTTGGSQQITSPSGPTSTSSLAAVNGKLTYNGSDLAILTSLNMQLNGQLEGPPVVGANIVPNIFQGVNRVAGSFSALFTDETIANTFYNETEVAISMFLTMGNGANADFMRFTLPRVKAMSAQKTDGTMSLVQNFNFTALENVDDAEADLTTIVIQDSLVT